MFKKSYKKMNRRHSRWQIRKLCLVNRGRSIQPPNPKIYQYPIIENHYQGTCCLFISGSMA